MSNINLPQYIKTYTEQTNLFKITNFRLKNFTTEFEENLESYGEHKVLQSLKDISHLDPNFFIELGDELADICARKRLCNLTNYFIDNGVSIDASLLSVVEFSSIEEEEKWIQAALPIDICIEHILAKQDTQFTNRNFSGLQAKYPVQFKESITSLFESCLSVSHRYFSSLLPFVTVEEKHLLIAASQKEALVIFQHLPSINFLCFQYVVTRGFDQIFLNLLNSHAHILTESLIKDIITNGGNIACLYFTSFPETIFNDDKITIMNSDEDILAILQVAKNIQLSFSSLQYLFDKGYQHSLFLILKRKLIPFDDKVLDLAVKHANKQIIHLCLLESLEIKTHHFTLALENNEELSIFILDILQHNDPLFSSTYVIESINPKFSLIFFERILKMFPNIIKEKFIFNLRKFTDKETYYLISILLKNDSVIPSNFLHIAFEKEGKIESFNYLLSKIQKPFMLDSLKKRKNISHLLPELITQEKIIFCEDIFYFTSVDETIDIALFIAMFHPYRNAKWMSLIKEHPLFFLGFLKIKSYVHPQWINNSINELVKLIDEKPVHRIISILINDLENSCNTIDFWHLFHISLFVKQVPPENFRVAFGNNFFNYTLFLSVQKLLNDYAEVHNANFSFTDITAASINLTLLFNNLKKINKYINKFICNSNQPFYNQLYNALNFHLPEDGTWNAEFWSRLLLLTNCHKNILQLLPLAAEIELHINTHVQELQPFIEAISKGKNMVAKDLQAFFRAITSVVYGNIPKGAEEFAYNCVKSFITFSVFQDIIKHASSVKSYDYFPDIEIKIDKYPHLTLKKMDPNDLDIFTIGKATSCCQYMGGNGQNPVLHSANSPFGCLLVLNFEPPNQKAIYLAMAWGSYTKKGELVLDSIETSNSIEVLKEFQKLETINEIVEAFFREAATNLLQLYPEIPRVLVGGGGGTPMLLLDKEYRGDFYPLVDYPDKYGYDSEELRYLIAKNSLFTNSSKDRYFVAIQSAPDNPKEKISLTVKHHLSRIHFWERNPYAYYALKSHPQNPLMNECHFKCNAIDTIGELSFTPEVLSTFMRYKLPNKPLIFCDDHEIRLKEYLQSKFIEDYLIIVMIKDLHTYGCFIKREKDKLKAFIYNSKPDNQYEQILCTILREIFTDIKVIVNKTLLQKDFSTSGVFTFQFARYFTTHHETFFLTYDKPEFLEETGGCYELKTAAMPVKLLKLTQYPLKGVTRQQLNTPVNKKGQHLNTYIVKHLIESKKDNDVYESTAALIKKYRYFSFYNDHLAKKIIYPEEKKTHPLRWMSL